MPTTEDAFLFGPFRLDPSSRSLTRDGTPVPLSARAFDVLQLLLRRGGSIVTRDEILAEVWRGVTVEENNLTVQVSALRRALGDGPGGAPVILTVPNQGYRVAGPVRRVGPDVPAAREDGAGPKADDTAPAWRAAAPPRAARRRGLAMAAGLALSLAGAFGVWWRFALEPARPVVSMAPAVTGAPRLSLVILPFRNLGEDRHDDSLADAISDDLTTEMAHMPTATVIARQSADSYKGRAIPINEIGRSLNVRYALEASLRGVDSALSVNAQLVDAQTGAHLWAARFDVPRTPQAGAQYAIVRRLAGELRKKLVLVAGERSLQDRPDHPDAMDYYLRAGVVWSNETSRDADIESRRLLEKAIALQPDFEPALAELGWEIGMRPDVFSLEGSEADLEAAHRVVARALQLDRYDPNALAAHARLLDLDGKYAEAEANFQAALAVDPDHANALNGLWRMQAHLGRYQQAFDTLSHLQNANPADPDAVFWNVHRGILSLWLGRPAEAAALIRKGMAGEPDPVPGGPIYDNFGYHRVALAIALAMSGDVEHARQIVASDSKVWPHRSVFRFAGYFSMAAAKNPQAPKMLAALEQAGMPRFADEHEDAGVAPSATPAAHGDYDPTPLSVPGIPALDTRGVAKMLLAQGTPEARPLLVDLGVGVTWPRGELRMFHGDPLSMEVVRHFVRDMPGPAGRPVIVFGDGPFGWRSYNAALQLKAAGVANVIWYRGGEEAWTASGLPADSVFPKLPG